MANKPKAVEVTPIPIPEPIVQNIYAVCVPCKGTGKISLTQGDLPPLEVTCDRCSGTGKILFGTIES